jgi:hypothetical protein
MRARRRHLNLARFGNLAPFVSGEFIVIRFLWTLFVRSVRLSIEADDNDFLNDPFISVQWSTRSTRRKYIN